MNKLTILLARAKVEQNFKENLNSCNFKNVHNSINLPLKSLYELKIKLHKISAVL